MDDIYLQNRTPLYDAEAFPRVVTVYISSNSAGDAFSARDIDATTNRGVVIVGGNVPSSSIREQIANVATTVRTTQP